MLTLIICMTGCAQNAAEEAPQEGSVEETRVEAGPKAVKTIDDIDEDCEPDEPIQIQSITLYEDGTVGLIPADKLKENEVTDEDKTELYPFADSGKVKDVFVVGYGNEGCRTVAAVLKDGSISVVNGSALVHDHIIAVMDNVGGRNDFKTIRNDSDEGGRTIIGITRDDEEVILDRSLNF